MSKVLSGMIIKMTGLTVKKENGVFEVSNVWEKDCSVYKLKKDGSRIIKGLDIFSFKKIEQYGEVINMDQVPAAIAEINKQLKTRKENEIVVSYESTNKKEYATKSYIRVIQRIHTKSSIYAIPTNSVFQLTINEKWNNVTWERIGKRGEIITSGDKSLMSWKVATMEKLISEGFIEIVERVEMVRKDVKTPENDNYTTSTSVTEDVQTVETPQNEISASIEVVEAQPEAKQEEQKEINKQQEEVKETVNNDITVTYKLNGEKNGVEIYFDSIPSEEVREVLKANKFKWSRNNSCWYAKQSESTISLAKQLAGDQTQTADNSDNVKKQDNLTQEQTEINTAYTYPEIDIEDNDSYVIDQSLQDREHDSNWVMRKNKPDRTKEIQEYFTELTNEVKEIINSTSNEYIIYTLKKTLQYYKKNYFNNYVARLRNKAENPSWIVTGAAGRNRSRDQKYNSRYDKLMQEWIDLDNDYKKRISSLKSKIRKEKESILKEAVNNTDISLSFATETKEFEFMGLKEKKRVYIAGNYFITKTWGCFRIFNSTTGKEVHSMKMTEKLDDAKRHVVYLIQQEQTKKAV